jgi:trehalose-phosphatase
VDALARLAAEPQRAALFFDIDGVLAPIVTRPEDAAVPEPTRAELRRLVTKYGLTACVTGRPSESARMIVGVPELTYVGEHGLELDGDAAAWGARIHAFARTTDWSDLELKPHSAAYHYRTASDHEAARRALEAVATAALAAGFKTRWGRLVLEVLPPIGASKGVAVRSLLALHSLDRALYAGDDTTDLDAFAALDGLDTAVRIAVVSPEAPSELGERADVVIGSTDAVLELMRNL